MPSKAKSDVEDEDFMEQDELEEPTPSRSSKRLSQVAQSNKRTSPRKSGGAAKGRDKSQSVEVIDSSSEEDKSKLAAKKSNAAVKAKADTSVSSSSSKKSGKKLAVDDDDDEDELMNDVEEVKDSEDGEEEGDEYVIQAILNHRVKKDGTHMYKIRWEGYGEEDDTWEPETNCNAPELVEEYWKSLPSSKQVRKKQEQLRKLAKLRSPKKKFQDEDDVDDANGDLEAAEVDNTLNIDNSSDTAEEKEEENVVEDSEEEEQRLQRQRDREFSEEMMTKWGREVTWEPLIQEIETVVRDEDNQLRAFIVLKSGEKFWAEKEIVYTKCPQAMLQFYEDHLRFRSGN